MQEIERIYARSRKFRKCNKLLEVAFETVWLEGEEPYSTAHEQIRNRLLYRRKCAGATTDVYTQAHAWLQELATMANPIHFTFSTDNPVMKLWAHKYAKGIFGQDAIFDEVSYPGYLVVRTTIYPKE